MGSSIGSQAGLPEIELSGKTIVVTGANTGIGYETAKALAQMGAKVIVACRSEAKANEAMERMRKEHEEEKTDEKKANIKIKADKLDLVFMALDLSSLASTMAFVEAYKTQGLPLHVLVCNAGIMWNDEDDTTDGFEPHFQVNYLSHFLLTLHLLPVLKSSGPNNRIVYVSSLVYRFAKWSTKDFQSKNVSDKQIKYSNSKLYQIMNMFSLAQRLEGSGVSVLSLHPGIVKTELATRETNQLTASRKVSMRVVSGLGLFRNPFDGALTTLHAVANPAYEGKTALYFESSKPVRPTALPRNKEKQELLWTYSLECLKDYVTDETMKELTSQ